METTSTLAERVEVSVSNVGGIDETSIRLRPGVNVLAGRNATNRTSFLQAIMAALGSDRPSLKADADEGEAELVVGDDRYRRRLERRNGEVVFSGEPYLEDAELADLFAFLLESNEARRAVGRGEDLRELIMRPIDTDEINAEIQLLEAEKREIDGRLEELEERARELPELEARRTAVTEEIETAEAELAEVEERLERLEADVDESRSQQAALEETFTELRSARRELDRLEYDIETERESREELERERVELEREREELEADDGESADRLGGRIDELRERKRSLETTLNELQSVVRFNEERLEDGGIGLATVDDAETNGGAVTDRLVEDDEEIVCWTCGSNVDRERIETTLDRLRELHREQLTERAELDDRIEELSERRKRRRERRRKREELTRRLETIESDLDRHDERIAELEAERTALRERIDALEAEAESLEEEDAEYDDVLEAHREANELEIRLEGLREDRETIEDRIDELEELEGERDSLRERRTEIESELTELRTRVERTEAEAVEAFNEHMASILSILEYANIERIWIERREREVREGRRTVRRSAFDLHVVRSSASGTTYEDTVEHLSESEREVTGLVFTLAGYLVHDVHEVVPFMLLDSLEAIDSARIADVVDYFEEFVDCLVVALLPEDARPLSEEYNYVTEI